MDHGSRDGVKNTALQDKASHVGYAAPRRKPVLSSFMPRTAQALVDERCLTLRAQPVLPKAATASLASSCPIPAAEPSLYNLSPGVSVADQDHTRDTQGWQTSKIPEEIREVPKELAVPKEILNIIRDSMTYCEALRESALSALSGVPESTAVQLNYLDHSQLPDRSALVFLPRRSTKTLGPTTLSGPKLSVDTIETPTPASINPNSVHHATPQSSLLPDKQPSSNLDEATPVLLDNSKPQGASLDCSAAVKSPKAETTRECASCFDDVPKKSAVALKCRHFYCVECLKGLVTAAMENENFWPPKCCLIEIPGPKLNHFLSAETVVKYKSKAKEYGTPAGDRWYCAKPECGKYFAKTPSRTYDTKVDCPHCRHQMCRFCRANMHPVGERCVSDRGLEATLAAAELEGWRQCYNCHAMVELATGCRHITCKCKAEFCYTCGARWQTCQCTEQTQVTRRTHLQGLRDRARQTAQQEEKEMQAALDAVAQFERSEWENQIQTERHLLEEAARAERLESEREAALLQQEMKQIEIMEAVRVNEISLRFIALRDSLEEIHKMQRRAMVTRYNSESAVSNLRRQELLMNGIATLQSENEELIRITRHKHAKQTLATASRHRLDQDRFLESLTREMNDGSPKTDLNSGIFVELGLQQQLERQELNEQQQREINKFRDRSERNYTTKMAESEALLEKERTAEADCQKMRQHRSDDLRWWEFVKTVRISMLEEDQQFLVLSGGDILPVSTYSA